MYFSTDSQKSNPHISRKGGIPLGPGIKKLLTLLAVFLGVWLSLRFVLPLISPFLLGAALALAAEPMVSFLHKSAGIPRPVSTGIGVSMTFCFLAMLVLVLCAILVRELGNLAGVLPDMEQTAGAGIDRLQAWLLELSGQAPEGVRSLLEDNVESLFSDGTALVNKAVGYLLGFAGNLLSHVPDSALSLGTAVVSGYMISAKLPRIHRWVKSRLPRERLEPVFAAWQRVKSAVGGWLAAQCKLMGVTFAILSGGFLILRIPYALLWAAVVALVDAFPVLGTGTVLLPWSLICLLQVSQADPQSVLEADRLALGCPAMGSEQLEETEFEPFFAALEPRLVGRHMGLDPLITLIALYAGYKLWGIGGMLLAPLLAVSALQLTPERTREDAP